MPDTSYLCFGVNDVQYAVPAEAVVEILPIPALTRVPDAPPYVAGVFNLRGRIVCVLNVAIRLGQSSPPFRTTDSVVLLRGSGRVIGIVVHQVFDLVSVSAEDTQPLDIDIDESTPSRFLLKAIKSGHTIRLLPDQDELIRLASVIPASMHEKSTEAPSVSLDESELQRRALQLMHSPEEQVTAELRPLAVIALNGEYFGIPLQSVRGFTDTRGIVRVPCCPPHIVGSVNLRGEVLTVIDIRGLLGMAARTAPPEKAIVVESDGLVVAVAVDDICDPIQIDPARIAFLPLAAESAGKAYLSGTVPYAERALNVVDITRILGAAELIVYEEV